MRSYCTYTIHYYYYIFTVNTFIGVEMLAPPPPTAQPPRPTSASSHGKFSVKPSSSTHRQNHQLTGHAPKDPRVSSEKLVLQMPTDPPAH